ncbi:hypothetical protein [Taibaiella chishuiensis]|uniref:Uncharacterized protein n=1 Tax=Taibaiella chishuiensis TaxID=1434707 RepID=A0A2P8DB45_9BACT|nr:hypothetical protein [Taibaiella chishuiensis]PSK94407.1 hypothetical protein B0I18_101563 [Taibaiella chishuiensis]
MKRIIPFLLLLGGMLQAGRAQATDEELKKKNLSDTILSRTRELLVPDPFDAQKVLLQLFPGYYYNLSHDNYTNELISWECRSCKPAPVFDANQIEENTFPNENGVATRLINVMDYKDAAGQQYKVMSFNHSEYDADGITTGRFSGGILGMAKFMRTPAGWKMRIFQPVIRAYGAFSQCPEPELLQIGEDQYAFMLRHINGGAGGPFDGDYYLVAGADGAYREVMAAYNTERTEGEGTCYWKSEYSCPPGDKKFFRDIVILTRGTYYAPDKEGLPQIVRSKLKGKAKGTFSLEQRYIYKGGKGYEAATPVCTVN